MGAGAANPNMWIYVKKCSISDAYVWIATFLRDLRLAYRSEPTGIYEGVSHDFTETAVFREGIGIDGAYLEINFTDYQRRWKTRADLAREAFYALGREVRWAPEQEHPEYHQGEFMVINEIGERLVDWDEEEEMEQGNDSTRSLP